MTATAPEADTDEFQDKNRNHAVQRQGVRLTTPTKSVLWIATILVLLIIAANFARWTGFPGKTPWDYLDVFLVPVAVGVATLWFTEEQNRRQRQAEKAQRERDLEVEDQRAQDATLQAYLDKMSELVLDKELHNKGEWYDPTRVTARARTLVALGRLDGERKRSIVQFLSEVQLINTGEEFKPRLVGLSGADLKHANLRYLALDYAALNGAILEDADLRDAKLSNVDLGGSYLSGADLSRANLSSASLLNAHLQRKDDLSLRGANLRDANLANADLSGANLRSAKGVTEEQLAECKSLAGATMPDGQILQGDAVPDGPTFEEWLKSQGRKEDGENE